MKNLRVGGQAGTLLVMAITSIWSEPSESSYNKIGPTMPAPLQCASWGLASGKPSAARPITLQPAASAAPAPVHRQEWQTHAQQARAAPSRAPQQSAVATAASEAAGIVKKVAPSNTVAGAGTGARKPGALNVAAEKMVGR
jgi:hypothetical protein